MMFQNELDSASTGEFFSVRIEVERVHLAGQKREIRADALRQKDAAQVPARLVLDWESHRRIVGDRCAPDRSGRRADVVFAVHLNPEAVPQPDLRPVDIEEQIALPAQVERVIDVSGCRTLVEARQRRQDGDSPSRQIVPRAAPVAGQGRTVEKRSAICAARGSLLRARRSVRRTRQRRCGVRGHEQNRMTTVSSLRAHVLRLGRSFIAPQTDPIRGRASRAFIKAARKPHSMNQPWLTISDWPVSALFGNACPN